MTVQLFRELLHVCIKMFFLNWFFATACTTPTPTKKHSKTQYVGLQKMNSTGHSRQDFVKSQTKLAQIQDEDQLHFSSAPLSGDMFSDQCQSMNDGLQMTPVWVAEAGLVVTRYLKPCLFPDTGERGVDSSSPWVAMGFPCTGGGQRIEIAGGYWSPKLVGFPLTTGCPMSEIEPLVVSKIAQQSLGLSENAPLAAVIPFATQYWEILGYGEAEVSDVVELRRPNSKKVLWMSFLKGEDIPVKLYGRENSFNTPDLYEVDAVIRKSADYLFNLQVMDVKKIHKEDENMLYERCEKKTSLKKCSQVFNFKNF